MPVPQFLTAMGNGTTWAVAVEIVPSCVWGAGDLCSVSFACSWRLCMWVLWGCSHVLRRMRRNLGTLHQQPLRLVLLQKSLPGGWRSLREGLVPRALRDPAAASHRPALLHLLSHTLGLSSAVPALTTSDSPQAFVTEMEVSTSRTESGPVGTSSAVPAPLRCPEAGAVPHGSLPRRVSSSLGLCWSS